MFTKETVSFCTVWDMSKITLSTKRSNTLFQAQTVGNGKERETSALFAPNVAIFYPFEEGPAHDQRWPEMK